MKVWLRLAIVSIPLLLALGVTTTPAGAEPGFVHIQFADSSRTVTMTLPTTPCRMDRAHTESCTWQLFLNEPMLPGQPVVGTASGTSGVLSLPYPAGFCGVLQADAMFGTPLRKVVGHRHLVSTCSCPTWPGSLTGPSPVDGQDAAGFYIAEINNNWTLEVTHPHGYGQVFAGTITTNSALTNFGTIKLEPHDSAAQVAPNRITFRFVNRGRIDGIDFTYAPTCGSQITFNATVNGQPVPPSQIFLGSSLVPAPSSPLSFSG